MSRLSIRDRIREIQDDDIDQVLQRYPIKIPTYPHTKTFDVFMEDAEDAARLKVDQAGEIDDLKTKHEREVDALKVRHERESNRQKSDDESEKEREANQAKRQSESVEEAYGKKKAKGKDIAKKMMKSKTMKAFAKKVAKMSKVTASDLDKILPDYVSGGDIGALFGEEVKESYSRSLVNKAIKLIKSPKYFQGDYTGAVKAIEKLKKGLSDDPKVREMLKIANESVSELDQRKYKKVQEWEDAIEASGDKEAYQKFFNKAMKKFGISSPDELEGDKKKKFFDYVDKNWKGDHEEVEIKLDGRRKNFREKMRKLGYTKSRF